MRVSSLSFSVKPYEKLQMPVPAETRLTRCGVPAVIRRYVVERSFSDRPGPRSETHKFLDALLETDPNLAGYERLISIAITSCFFQYWPVMKREKRARILLTTEPIARIRPRKQSFDYNVEFGGVFVGRMWKPNIHSDFLFQLGPDQPVTPLGQHKVAPAADIVYGLMEIVR